MCAGVTRSETMTQLAGGALGCTHAQRRSHLLAARGIVALVLFAGVLLGMLGTGQLVLATLHECDLRPRALFAEHRPLTSWHCVRASANRSGSAGRLGASWTVTDLLDVVRLAWPLPSRSEVDTHGHDQDVRDLRRCRRGAAGQRRRRAEVQLVRA